ncbi:hypothetical protein PENTCL1PPCAC_1211, partial [Pristionchus entomophagus]
MDDIVNAESTYNNIAALLLFFVWIKIFKCISFNKTLSQLPTTLSRSAKGIASFACMFFLIFFAFAQFGYLVFGTQIQDYSTIFGASFALVRFIRGDFDFRALERANRVLGPLFFLTFDFSVCIILLGMFLAIINSAYGEMKEELARQPDDYHVASFVSKSWYRFLRALHLARDIPDVEREIDFKAWKAAFKTRGFTNVEINDKFDKFEVLSWNEMNEGAREELESELETEQREKRRRAKQHREVNRIASRVEAIETAILAIAVRIETVVGRLKTMELEKVRS